MNLYFKYLLARYAPKCGGLYSGINHLPDEIEWRKLLLMQSTLRKGDTAIDVGAHIGHYTKLMSGWVGKEGQIIAYEPNPYVFKVLSRYTKRRTNIHINQCAVSANSDQDLVIRLHPYSLYQDSSVELIAKERMSGFTKQVKIKTTALDDLRETISSPIKLIKIDVEGHEEKVFQGAQKLLKQDRPIVIFEFYSEENVVNPPTILQMNHLNYVCYDLNNLHIVEASSPPQGSVTDILALPKEHLSSYEKILDSIKTLIR